MAGEREFYVRVGGRLDGPLTSAALRKLVQEGKVVPETQVLLADTNKWVKASRIEALWESKETSATFSSEAIASDLGTDVLCADTRGHTALDSQAAAHPEEESPACHDKRPPQRENPKPVARSSDEVVISKESLGLWAGSVSLTILGVSAFFPWVRVGLGGVVGIAGDGKVVLAASVCCLGLYILGHWGERIREASRLVCGAWGTVAAVWHGALLWRLSTLADSRVIGDPIGNVLATQFGPGSGLYIGFLSALAVVAIFTWMAADSFAKGNLKRHVWIGVELSAVAVGIGMAACYSSPGTKAPTSPTATVAKKLSADVAVSKLRELGADVEVNGPERNLIDVDFSNRTITESGLAILSEVPGLWELNLKATKMTDDRMRHLADLTSLKELDLSNNRIGDAGLIHLANLQKLGELDASENQIAGTGLCHLAGLSMLRHLDLSKNFIGDNGLIHLVGLPKLSFLDLSENQITNQGLLKLSSMTQIRLLDVDGNRGITDSGMIAIGQLTQLEMLFLEDTNITDHGLSYLTELKNLEHLSLPPKTISSRKRKWLEGKLPKADIWGGYGP